VCPRPTGRASGRSTSNDNDAKEHHQRQEPHDENLPLKMRAAPEDSQTIFRLGRFGRQRRRGGKALQVGDNLEKCSGAGSHPAPPEAPISSDFACGLCLGTRAPGSSGGASQGGPDRLLSVNQLAEHLGVTTATVYGLCAHGRLAQVRTLNVIRIAPSDLSEFIASCRRLTRTQSATSNGRFG
jgi:excisionase family DNA binding protein